MLTSILAAADNGEARALSALQTSTKKSKRSRHRKKTPQEAKPQTALSALPGKRDEPALSEVKNTCARNIFVYVVEASVKSEGIIGVFNSVANANQRATEYALQLFGMSDTDIVDITGSFSKGHSNTGSQPMATRRVWPNGATEIRLLSYDAGPRWIKVLPKRLTVADGEPDPRTAYLALDRSNILFIIGAYTSKGEAWEACRKYWTQLSYGWGVIHGMKHWFDEQWMFHAQGSLGDLVHHWFVEPYDVI